MKRLFAIIIVLLLPCGMVFSQKKETYRVRTVVIDPGHGGAKPGAQGSRSQEKNITLSVAKKFGKLLQDNYPDLKIIYTRTTDVDISLGERARIANRNKADLFISIHANSHPTSTPTGVETFVMGLSESKANLEVARKENADILLEADYKNNADYKGFDPNSPESYVMLAMFQNDFIDKSLNFAQAIQTQYKQNIKTINRGVKQAELFVLYKTTCPSVLTEIGFISNPTEEAFMLSDEGQAKIAISLFNAFMTYKATEEGTNKPANPVINLQGYKAPADAKQPEAKQLEAKPEPKPETQPEAVAEVKEEPQPEPKVEPQPEVKPQPEIKAEPKAEHQPEVKPEPKVEPQPEVKPEPKIETPATPVAKPTPTVELPKVEEPKPEPQPQEVTPEVPAAAPVPTPVKETLRAPQNTADTLAKEYYTVQFMTIGTELRAGAPELNGISEFQTFRQGRNVAYITGRFATREEAAAYCEHLKRTTRFKDAWSYLYKPSARSGAQPQASTETKTAAQPAAAKQPSVASGKVSYRIQFCTARKKMKEGDSELQGIKDVRTSQSGKLYIYTTGNYSSLQDAERRCNEIKRSTTFKDAFVFGVYKGQRITIEQAAEIEKETKK